MQQTIDHETRFLLSSAKPALLDAYVSVQILHSKMVFAKSAAKVTMCHSNALPLTLSVPNPNTLGAIGVEAVAATTAEAKVRWKTKRVARAVAYLSTQTGTAQKETSVG